MQHIEGHIQSWNSSDLTEISDYYNDTNQKNVCQDNNLDLFQSRSPDAPAPPLVS
jgi:hypothetical protein